MFVSIFILMFSVAALLYWLRTTCTELLKSGSVRVAEAQRVAEANRLEFQRVRAQLERESRAEQLDSLRDSLRHDFLALTYLLRYAATVNVGKYSREERLLIADFHLMRVVYNIGQRFSPSAARFALLEMSSILEYFAAVMNRRMEAFSARMVQA